MQTPEGEVKAKLKAWLDVRGAYHFWPVQTGMGARGIDCYTCFAGRFIAYECKAYGCKPTALQRKILEDTDKAGGMAFIVTTDETGEHLLFIPVQAGGTKVAAVI